MYNRWWCIIIHAVVSSGAVWLLWFCVIFQPSNRWMRYKNDASILPKWSSPRQLIFAIGALNYFSTQSCACDNDLHWYVAVMVVIIQNLLRRRVMAPKDKTALFIHSEDFVCLANLYSPALGLNDDFDSLMPQGWHFRGEIDIGCFAMFMCKIIFCRRVEWSQI